MAKKSLKKINRRSEILQAARKLMVEKGLTGVTTREISKEVGCSEGASRQGVDFPNHGARLSLSLRLVQSLRLWQNAPAASAAQRGG